MPTILKLICGGDEAPGFLQEDAGKLPVIPKAGTRITSTPQTGRLTGQQNAGGGQVTLGFRQLLAQVRHRSLIVLLTSLDAAAIHEGLLPELKQLARRHTVIVASVADPRIAEMAAGRGTANAVFAAASSELALSVRRGTAAELDRIGVEVVDAVPSEFAPALADKYLSLKAQGKL